MRLASLAVLLSVVSWGAAGCTESQPQFQSKIDPSFHGNVTRILFIHNDMDPMVQLVGTHFYPDFDKEFATRLQRKGIVFQSVSVSKDELNPADIIKPAVAKFRPTHLLEVTEVRTEGNSQYGYKTHVGFKLLDARTGRAIWQTEGYFPPFVSPAGDVTANQVLNQMESTHLLPDKVSPQEDQPMMNRIPTI